MAEERPPLHVDCPTCGRTVPWTADSPWRPFCSERCKLIDLGEWFEGNNRIPGEEAPPDEGGEDSSQF